jgi:hypothetical protein
MKTLKTALGLGILIAYPIIVLIIVILSIV